MAYSSTAGSRKSGAAISSPSSSVRRRGIENQSLRLRRKGKKPSREPLFRLELADFAFFDSQEDLIT
jgi:hypothetical protein